MGERLASGNVAVALLVNALATGAMLVVLILVFGTTSGAHLNPLVSLSEAQRGGLPWRSLPLYVAAQIGGAVAGVVVAHLMFELPLFAASRHARAGAAQWLSEAVATFGLLMTIAGTGRHRPNAVPFAVGAYITAAYFFTSSTSFANPAVTLARALTDTFSGIRPNDVAAFLAAQLFGAIAATTLCGWLWRTSVAERRVFAAEEST